MPSRNPALVQDPKNDTPPVSEHTWDELALYVRRYIGFQVAINPSTGNPGIQHASGEKTFEDLPAGASKELDREIRAAIQRLEEAFLISSQLDLASIFDQSIGEFLPNLSEDEKSKTLRTAYQEAKDFREKEVLVSRGCWYFLQKNPDRLLLLQILLKGELAGKITLKIPGVPENGNRISQKKWITIPEIMPYVKGYIVAVIQQVRDPGLNLNETYDKVNLKVCGPVNKLIQYLKPEEIDATIAATMFKAFIAEAPTGGLFIERASEAYIQALQKSGIDPEEEVLTSIARLPDETIEAYQLRVQEERQQLESTVNARMWEILEQDRAWKYMLAGILIAAFEKKGLPPLVLF